MLSLDEDGFGMQPWDSQSSLFDQPINHLGSGIDEWLPRSWSDLMSSPEALMGHSMSDMIAPTSANHPPIGETYGVSSEPPTLIDHQNEVKNQPMKRKGRPKLDSDNTLSAKERRRAQVRLAQHAYRQRKEGYAKSLQKENDDLKDRLSKVQISFGKLLAIITEANLPLQQLDIIQTLTREVEKNKLPQVFSGENHQVKEDGHSKKSFTCSTDDLELSSDILPATEIESYAPSRSSELQGYGRDSFHVPYLTPRLLKEPSFSPFDQIPSTSLPFGLRLRIEALKRGYQLITSSETSFAALRRAFHQHIFSETREGIIKRIYLHLSQSMKAIDATAAGNWNNNELSDSFNPELFRITFPQTPDQRLSDRTARYSTAIEDPAIKGGVHTSTAEAYIYSEDISRHLLQKGLDITTGFQVVSMFPGQGSRTSQAPSLFDEIIEGRKLRLSVSKLLQELLDRVTCLEFGPGFQQTEIDEALRLTIIEAV
ncbi:hypothetical protein N431DRAFT_561304 [Stipitochalara longipes BDJ]|nr:hypothetical protein N431DRAFT_561304 [Stipitochalara longipes BDJ]